ncbi:MAG: RNA methyltransferase [Pirellula sp.]|nr:RNA methyltransferase [Pirellula sp.]
MSVQLIDSIDHAKLDPYRHLRTSNLTRFSGRFIAESKPLVSRLITSGLQVESVLIDEKFQDEALSWIPDRLEVLVVPSEWIEELVGFNFHRGYLACGVRPRSRTLAEFCENWKRSEGWTGCMLVGVQDPENMGSILRTCAALGISDIFVGPDCVDPFARRVLRVSMGNAFKLNFFSVKKPVEAVMRLREIEIQTIATCFAQDSEELAEFQRSGPSVVLMGNEAHGLPELVQRAADRRLMIAMDLSTDSLNVSVATGIILHNLCRVC